MTKGTPSKGKRASGKTHIRCRRCGRHSYHVRRKICAACGFGKTSKLKKGKFLKRKINRTRKPNK